MRRMTIGADGVDVSGELGGSSLLWLEGGDVLPSDVMIDETEAAEYERRMPLSRRGGRSESARSRSNRASHTSRAGR